MKFIMTQNTLQERNNQMFGQKLDVFFPAFCFRDSQKMNFSVEWPFHEGQPRHQTTSILFGLKCASLAPSLTQPNRETFQGCLKYSQNDPILLLKTTKNEPNFILKLLKKSTFNLYKGFRCND